MYGLPEQTQLRASRGKKEDLKKHLEASQRSRYQEAIKTVKWRHKLAAHELNVADGKNVHEVEVFELELNQSEVPEPVLRAIDKAIPYHLLFVCQYQEKCQLWMAYKEFSQTGIRKIGSYYHTGWQPVDEVQIHIQGLNMDDVYANLLRSLGGAVLEPSEQGENLAETVERSEKRQNLQKKIDQLTKKMNREVQLSRQMEIRKEIKQLQKEWKEL